MDGVKDKKKSNSNLHKAKDAKNDEFYTQLSDIEKELKYYRKHFKDKVVFCNCDDPTWSGFFKFFHKQFDILGLKKLISTHYVKDTNKEKSYKLVVERDPYTGEIWQTEKTELKGNGDFRSDECLEILKEADIVCTNPPFSLFREYVAQLVEYDKKFLIIGNKNAITYKEIFPLIKDNRLWLGYLNVKDFIKPDGSTQTFGNVGWYTNLDISKRNEELVLIDEYDEKKYPKYDNYDAIEVSKVANIPKDYYEAMGVPITFLDKYNPEQFEILGFRKGKDGKDLVFTREREQVTPYFRILIKRKV